MRSVLLVIFSALALAGGFLAYWVSQPHSSVSVKPPIIGAVEPPTTQVGTSTIRPGEEVWIRERDANFKVKTEFRGDRFDPRANGSIDVTNPVANFYLAGNQRLQVTGVTANIVMKEMPGAGKAGPLSAGPTSPPSRGRLDNVTLKLIDQTTNQPTLTMRTRNVVFDNETFLISTEGYRDENGVELTNDQVPVHIVGQESGQGHAPYLKQMEGRGLTVRWNDRDGRLELLEIRHGDFLVIDNASSPVLPGSKPKSTALQAGTFSAPLAGMLASADPQAAGQVIAPPASRVAAPVPAPRAGRSTIVYRASFFENVRINQPDPSGGFDQVLIDNVSQMDVDFRLSNGGTPSTRPAATSAPSATAPDESPALTPETEKDIKPIETQPARSPATQPAPATQIIIHWTGRLFMTPLLTTPWSPLRPGEGAVKLIGFPVHVHRIDPTGGGFEDIRAATALYATGGDHVQLDHSRQFPNIYIDRNPPAAAKDKRQTHLVSTGQIHYARDAQVARCIGKGFADVPMEADGNGPPANLHASWTRLAEFTMGTPAAGSQMALREGHFAGDVDIQHPRMALKSDELVLYFDQVPTRTARGTPGVQQTLKQAVATTKVFCQLTGSDLKKQSIEANRLVLDTGISQGKLYPSHVSAAGSVHAYTDDELRADNLDVTLKPAPARDRPAKPATRKSDSESPSVELQEMVAWGNVVTKSKDGSIATGDKLTVTGSNGKQHAVIASATGAKVINPKGNLVMGPEIEFDSGDGRAYIIGAGHMEALKPSTSTTQPAEKITVTWATSAMFNGVANRIDADGSVHVDTIDSRGFHDEGVADHVRVDLEHKPEDSAATQPSAQLASVAESPAVIPATAGPPSPTPDAGQMNLFKDKEVVAITFEGHAHLNSTLPGRDGAVEQQMVLEGPRIIIREVNPDGSRSKSMSVPTVGRLLVRDHREAGSGKKGEAGDLHGAMLFTWQRSLLYSEATRRADMVGSVDIQYFPSQGELLPAHITGDHMIVYFDNSPAASAPKTAPAKDAAGTHIQMVRIFGSDTEDVSVLHGTDVMKARQVDFDPPNHKLIASGTPQNPVFFFNGDTMQTSLEHAEWDTLTWNPRLLHATIQYHPHADTSTPKPKGK